MKTPPHISNNFIYRKFWNDIHRRKKNATLLALGEPGSGKSWSCLRMAADLDPSFEDHIEERVCFKVSDFFKLLKEKQLTRGKAAVLDELAGSEYGADSRSFMSAENQMMSFLITTFRKIGTFTFFVLPHLGQLDKRLRTVGVGGVFIFKKVYFTGDNRGKSLADFRWGTSNPLTGDVYLPRPRLRVDNRRILIESVLVPQPTEKVTKVYEKMKDDFIYESIDRWYADLEAREKQGVGKMGISVSSKITYWGKEIAKDPTRFKEGDRYNTDLIQSNSGLSRENCRILRRMAIKAEKEGGLD